MNTTAQKPAKIRLTFFIRAYLEMGTIVADTTQKLCALDIFY